MDPRTPRRALVLVGHGSHLSADSSTPVYAHAARLREMRVFDEVLEAFWKEEPSLRDVLDLVESPDIYVVPLFLAEGYFTRQVVPRELGIEGADTLRDGRTIRYCAPVGTHPSMASLVVRRALEMPGLSEDDLPSTTLLIIGHGTTRSRTSGDTVYRLVEEVRAMGLFGAVDCGFLDEDPRIADVLARTDAETVVLVPFFLAEGWHTATTIPEEIGLDPLTDGKGVEAADGRRIWYSPPVGTMPELAEVVLDLVASASLPAAESESSASGPDPSGGRADHQSLATRARHQFTEWLRNRREALTIMQVSIDRTPEDRYRLTHCADSGRTDALRLLRSLSELLSVVRFNDSGDYRPLRTTNDLPRGWVMDLDDESAVWNALSMIYPSALVHRYRWDVGTLDIVSYRTWADRQTGIYEVVGELSGDEVAQVVERCCGSCLRHPLWYAAVTPSVSGGASRPSHSVPGLSGTGSQVTDLAPTTIEIPCREPCTLFATLAREHREGR